jgi:hypothetical protein
MNISIINHHSSTIKHDLYIYHNISIISSKIIQSIIQNHHPASQNHPIIQSSSHRLRAPLGFVQTDGPLGMLRMAVVAGCAKRASPGKKVHLDCIFPNAGKENEGIHGKDMRQLENSCIGDH